MTNLIVIAYNIRSCYNVGSFLRTMEGLGYSQFYAVGITPFPRLENDPRPVHVIDKIDRNISKTALGAEKNMAIKYHTDISTLINQLKATGYIVAALEQSPNSISLIGYTPPNKLALIVGPEVTGIEDATLKTIDQILEIPMFGKKESYNVAQALAMALYQFRFN